MPETQTSPSTITPAQLGEAVGAALSIMQLRSAAAPVPAQAAAPAAPVGSIAAVMERARANTVRHIPDAVPGREPIRVRLSAENVRLDTIRRIGGVAAADSNPDPDNDGDVDATPDTFWETERERLGLTDVHDNAMYLVMTLTHADQVMNNYCRDFIPLDEHIAAAPTLIGQPIDMADTMDCHERERLWGSNGIRGWIYAQRTVGTACEIGVCVWALDFPESASQILDFRESLGGSYDLIAYDHLYENDTSADPNQDADETLSPGNYPIAQTRIKYSSMMDNGAQVPQRRTLKSIVYLGGSILTKSRAADPTTNVTDVRYGGKTADELLKERNTMGDNATTPNPANPAAANAAAETPPAAPVAPAAAPSPVPNNHEALVAAMAATQREAADLRAERDRLQAEVRVRDERIATAQQETTTELGNRQRAEAERDAARTELQTIQTRQASAQRATERMTVLDGLPAAETLTIPAFESDELRAAALAAITPMDDAAFENYRLLTLAGILRRARTAPGAAAAAPAPGTSPAAAAAAAAPPAAGLAGAASPSAEVGVTHDFTSFGKELAGAMRQGAPAAN